MTNPLIETRRQQLKAAALAAALAAHHQPSLEEVADLPTAVQQHKLYRLPLHCQFTGVSCGVLTLPTVAGYLPLLSQWKQQQVLHPLFSLELTPLLQFSKNTWIRFCSFSPDEAADQQLTFKQEQTLQIAALAMLHQLTSIRQDVPWMPDVLAVLNNWQSLISLCYWKSYLDSKRFKFPALRISKYEPTPDLHSFLQCCWDAKKAYESDVRSVLDEHQLKLAEDALLAIRGELAGKRPNSEKLLWKWFIASLPAKYRKDAAEDGWMKELFTAKGSNIFDFTVADIDLFEEIFLSECQTGSSISHSFLAVLDSKREMLTQHFEAFEILVPMELQTAAASGEIAVAEPKLQDFAKKPLWMIAHAKWRLTHGSAEGSATQHREAAALKQQQVSVTSVEGKRLMERNSSGFDSSDELEATSVEEAFAATFTNFED